MLSKRTITNNSYSNSILSVQYFNTNIITSRYFCIITHEVYGVLAWDVNWNEILNWGLELPVIHMLRSIDQSISHDCYVLGLRFLCMSQSFQRSVNIQNLKPPYWMAIVKGLSGSRTFVRGQVSQREHNVSKLHLLSSSVDKLDKHLLRSFRYEEITIFIGRLKWSLSDRSSWTINPCCLFLIDQSDLVIEFRPF
jgi:hypothetical protein